MGGEAGGRVPPRDFWPGNFCWPNGKIEARKKGKMEQKRRKIEKGKENRKREGWKVENWKWKEEKLQNVERTIFFFFFFFGLPKWKFSTGKKYFTHGKKSGKMTLPPQKKYSSYAPAQMLGRPAHHVKSAQSKKNLKYITSTKEELCL